MIVYFEKKDYCKGLALMPVMILLCIGLITFSSQMNFVVYGWPILTMLIFYVFFSIKVFLYFILVFFSFGLLVSFIYAPFFLKYKGPAAILDEKGIWVKNHNFIPWESIEKFDFFSIGSAPKSLGIWVEDRDVIYKQSNFSGKMAIFWTKIFKTPHITLANFDKEDEDILVFAHRYLRKIEK